MQKRASKKVTCCIDKKEIATPLEESFGKEKQHYYLNRIKALTKQSKIMWIFCGIHVGIALEKGLNILFELAEIAWFLQKKY